MKLGAILIGIAAGAALLLRRESTPGQRPLRIPKHLQLSLQQRRAIASCNRGVLSGIARQFGVSRQLVSQIYYGTYWSPEISSAIDSAIQNIWTFGAEIHFDHLRLSPPAARRWLAQNRAAVRQIADRLRLTPDFVASVFTGSATSASVSDALDQALLANPVRRAGSAPSDHPLHLQMTAEQRRQWIRLNWGVLSKVAEDVGTRPSHVAKIFRGEARSQRISAAIDSEVLRTQGGVQ